MKRKAKRFPLVLTPLPSPPPRYYMPLFISSLPLTIPHADSGFISCQTKTETHPCSCFFLNPKTPFFYPKQLACWKALSF